MKKTKDILSQLESKYKDIDYYFIVIQKIEENVDDYPDIAIESCKSLLEGLSKFIWKKIDFSYDESVVNKMEFHPLVRQAVSKLGDLNEDVEADFINKLNKLIVCIGEIRNKRGDISHGRLAPKSYSSDAHFSNLVANITDNMLYYILLCFSKISIVVELNYQDNPDFNEKLDSENPFGFLSYSKALFNQDLEAYRQELLNYQDSLTIGEQ